MSLAQDFKAFIMRGNVVDLAVGMVVGTAFSGKISPSHCAQSGIPAKGNMKPESSSEGRKKKNVSCIACICVRATVEMR